MGSFWWEKFTGRKETSKEIPLGKPTRSLQRELKAHPLRENEGQQEWRSISCVTPVLLWTRINGQRRGWGCGKERR